jgi:hypothetical protein
MGVHARVGREPDPVMTAAAVAWIQLGLVLRLLELEVRSWF